ncbi:MAG TPA: transcription termination/antitermination protein NusA [Dehalococcoidia bacterium]|jgi:N utilization substance protein A|nr:transcription termination/antitermination protein NusA [Dehalococcoidia bacterium]
MRSNELVTAIKQVSDQKGLDTSTVLVKVESAIASALRKDDLQYAEINVKINEDTSDITAERVYKVMPYEQIEDDEIEVAPDRAKEMGFASAKVGDLIAESIEQERVDEAGRVAAQTAKQVVSQGLREAEREAVFEEFSHKEGELTSAAVLRVEGGRKQVIVDLGRAEAVLPWAEQIRPEHYRQGQRIRVYIKEVYRAAKGPQIVVSRSHPDVLKRLFELEVPEIARGTVEIVAVARDAGFRSKVAVISRQHGIDPIGACVGPRGGRIQNIVTELGGERIDILRWDPNEVAYAANTISPAEVISISIDEAENTVNIGIPDKQMALAIGKEGQNARLAAQLIGRRVSLNAESMIMESGADLVPPPEPNLEAIPIVRTAPASNLGRDVVATDTQTDNALPLDTVHPDGTGVDSSVVKQLTPEQEVMAAFASDEESGTDEIVEPGAISQKVGEQPTTENKSASGGLRFGDDIAELRRDEDEESTGGQNKKNQSRRKRSGERGPQKQTQSRRFEYDEDEDDLFDDADDLFEL